MGCVCGQVVPLASDFKSNPFINHFHWLPPRRISIPERINQSFTAFLASEQMYAGFFIEGATQSSSPIFYKCDDCLFERRRLPGNAPVVALDFELLTMPGCFVAIDKLMLYFLCTKIDQLAVAEIEEHQILDQLANVSVRNFRNCFQLKWAARIDQQINIKAFHETAV